MNNDISNRTPLTARLGAALADLQGIITSGYDHLDHTAYLFLHFSRPALSRGWLSGLLTEITTADWKQPDGSIKKPAIAVNIAFSCHGLSALGFPSDGLQSFPSPFVEGMGSLERSRRLGDSGGSSPEHWEIGNPLTESGTPMDVLLMVQAPTRKTLDDYLGAWLKHHADHAVVLAAPVQYGAVLPAGGEHFGFADGISQPRLMGAPGRSKDAVDSLPTGEFVLGYLNAYDMLPATPMVSRKEDIGNHLPPAQHRDTKGLCDFGRNGTYVVFRKLIQNVAEFRRFVKQQDPAGTGLLAAKMVGRWPSGAPPREVSDGGPGGILAKPAKQRFRLSFR
jgi:deferrochelatase/peroxidase EfeB